MGCSKLTCLKVSVEIQINSGYGPVVEVRHPKVTSRVTRGFLSSCSLQDENAGKRFRKCYLACLIPYRTHDKVFQMKEQIISATQKARIRRKHVERLFADFRRGEPVEDDPGTCGVGTGIPDCPEHPLRSQWCCQSSQIFCRSESRYREKVCRPPIGRCEACELEKHS